jgi:putative aminopeptidase FrvX
MPSARHNRSLLASSPSKQKEASLGRHVLRCDKRYHAQTAKHCHVVVSTAKPCHVERSETSYDSSLPLTITTGVGYAHNDSHAVFRMTTGLPFVQNDGHPNDRDDVLAGMRRPLSNYTVRCRLQRASRRIAPAQEEKGMREESFAFLKRLVDTPGPSGYEQAVQRIYREAVSAYADEVRTDVMGNVFAVRNPQGKPRIMLAGHADEIGFQVRYISDDGMIYFGSIGGHDPVVTVGQRVQVHTASGPILGVLGRRAVHLMETEERGKSVKLDDLWIDIGVKDRKEAEALVSIGDCITYAQDLQPLQGSLCTARSFDNKMGVFVIAEALRMLEKSDLQAAVFAVSTVQEEIGLRGARASAYGVDPLVGLATDVGHAMDFPGAEKKRVGDIRLGNGPIITRGANINPRVFELLTQTARELEIPYQVNAAPGATGTDANAMQISRAGMATGLIGVPLRYMHTPSEVMNLDDIENAARLMAGFCERVTAEMDWTPL